jgi:penicillin-binding protein 2
MPTFLDLLDDELRAAVVRRSQAASPAPHSHAAGGQDLRAPDQSSGAELEAAVPSARPAPQQRARTRAWPRTLVASVIPAGAVGIAIVIAVASILLLRQSAAHHATGANDSSVRGSILGRNGEPLATSNTVPAVQITFSKLPMRAATLAAEGRRLFSGRLGSCRIPRHGIERLQRLPCLIAQARAAHLRSIVLPAAVSARKARLITAQERKLPGITIVHILRTTYPHGDLAAQVLGVDGRPPTGDPGGRSSPVASVGLSGLEYQYNRYLQAGDDLETAIDPSLQEAGQQALARSIARNPPATGGAFVALDPTNGQILAMGSSPTFDPNVSTNTVTRAGTTTLDSPGSGYPLINRATQSTGPTGSAFTPITAIAALQSGVWNVGETYDDTGQFCLRRFCLHNAGHAAYGVLDIASALRLADGVFFYNLGARLNADPFSHPNGGALQTWARQFGIGHRTGVDLPEEAPGALLTPNELKRLYRQEVECENAGGPYARHPKHPASAGGCGIATTPNWTVGYNVNTAVGQGNIQVTPLQLAVAYSALENDGTVVRPHVGYDIQSPGGTVIQKIDPPPRGHIRFDALDRQTILEGLRAAAGSPGGTSYDVMGDFPLPVYGKTGTAQYNRQQDYAWYAGFVPASATDRPIVVVVTVEQGGFGDVSAAPVARQILSQWFLGRPGAYRSGKSTTL